MHNLAGTADSFPADTEVQVPVDMLDSRQPEMMDLVLEKRMVPAEPVNYHTAGNSAAEELHTAGNSAAEELHIADNPAAYFRTADCFVELPDLHLAEETV